MSRREWLLCAITFFIYIVANVYFTVDVVFLRHQSRYGYPFIFFAILSSFLFGRALKNYIED